jgi:hypothetical protein
MWLDSHDLIPLVGGWEAEADDDDRHASDWIIPHPPCWLKFEYDNEFFRRSENLARAAAGDLYPIRRTRTILEASHIKFHVPPPETYPMPPLADAADSALSPSQQSKTSIRLFASGASEQDCESPSCKLPLGAAVAYLSKSDEATLGDPEDTIGAVWVELAARLDPGATIPLSADSQSRLKSMADLQGISLSLTVAASMRRIASTAYVTVASPHAPAALVKRCRAPIDRRRLKTGASDTSNMLQIYCLLQKPLALPRLEFSHAPPSTEGLARSSFRARRAGHAILAAVRDFPPSSDWCIVEHDGERVHGSIGSQYSRCAGTHRLKAWSAGSESRRLRLREA